MVECSTSPSLGPLGPGSLPPEKGTAAKTWVQVGDALDEPIFHIVLIEYAGRSAETEEHVCNMHVVAVEDVERLGGERRSNEGCERRIPIDRPSMRKWVYGGARDEPRVTKEGGARRHGDRAARESWQV